MKEKSFDRLLNRFFNQNVSSQRVRRLESDVWNQINVRQHGMRRSWLESVLAAVLVPQYQIATVAVAIMLGLFVGHVTTGSFNTENLSARRALNLQVFSAQDGGLFAHYHGERV